MMHKIDKSALFTVIGIILFFGAAISIVLIAPLYVDKAWVSPSSPYQVQMYEVEDPNVYISGSSAFWGGSELQYLHHLKQDYTLLAFSEGDITRIIAPPELESYITKVNEPKLKLTSRLLLLRAPQNKEAGEKKRKDLQAEWKNENPNWKDKGLDKPDFHILELYDPQVAEAFSYDPSQGLIQNWIDTDFVILDEAPKQFYHQEHGVVYVQNPREYRISPVRIGDLQLWHYDPEGEPIKDLSALKTLGLGFLSRKELISLGEHIYAIEGCWYCHTDQTRTLVQDVVLNGSDSFPAPPSSPNEYIYQNITFPGTRRIGPDLSRVGVKRPSRDWHKSHFWEPKTSSPGSIMPSFKHFFDFDPRGAGPNKVGIPNYKFEAVFQYLMTKGTRITAPTEAWWLGKDPIKTIDIIEGRR